MNHDYSDAFKSIVPEAPSPGGWAEDARRKRRHHRRIMGGVTAVAAVALVAPVALTLGGNSTLVATPGETGSPFTANADPRPDPTTDGPGAAACWDAPMQARAATKEGATDGAVRAWLCGDAEVSGVSLNTVGPLEPLVDGVDEIVDFIQAQQTLEESGVGVCTEEYRLSYRLVLDHDDGSRRVVPGALHGCQTIDDGPTVRTGGGELYDLALDLWREQRSTTGAPHDMDVVVDCPPGVSPGGPLPVPAMRPMLPLDPAAATSGMVCEEVTVDDEVRGEGGLLNDDLVALVGESVREDSVEMAAPDALPSWLTLTGAWGEHVVLQRTPDDRFLWIDGDTSMVWSPPDDLLVQLDGQLPPGRPTSPGPSSAEPGAATGAPGCDGVTRDDAATATLDDTLLTPERVWLCDGGAVQDPGAWGLATPLEPLELPGLVASAAVQFNALEPAEPEDPCLLDAGASYLVVFEYAAGTTHVVRVEMAGCREAAAGDTVRRGGDVYFDSLLEMWKEQRRALPPAQTRPGPLCPRASSVFELDPRGEQLVSGVACTGWEHGDAGPVAGEEVSLPDDLLAEVTQQLGTVTDAVEWTVLTGDNIILLTAAGDPVTLAGIDDGAFLVSGEAEEWIWTPTGAVAEELDALFNR